MSRATTVICPICMWPVPKNFGHECDSIIGGANADVPDVAKLNADRIGPILTCPTCGLGTPMYERHICTGWGKKIQRSLDSPWLTDEDHRQMSSQRPFTEFSN